MKGIYLPTFQRSIILQANEGYTKFTQLRQPLEGKTCFIACVFIYIIYRFYTDFSLFRQIKRQDTVLCGKVYLSQSLWQSVLDMTSLARCTWYNLYVKVYLIQPIWKGVFETVSMVRCIFKQPLWQGVLNSTSMTKCTRMYLIQSLWQGLLDTTSMARCT